MIYGIGTDIIEISRIKKTLNKNIKFMDKIFTKNEMNILKSKDYKAESVSGMFSAKEAIMKCFGTGLKGFSMKDMEVLRDELGKPIVILNGRLEEIYKNLNGEKIMISISHCKEYATATAILVVKDK